MARTRDPAAYAARQEAILDTAEALFAERGFHQTGIAALCEALGTSPGALYRYFPSKDDIVRALVRREAERTRARVDTLLGEVVDRETLLDALVVELLSGVDAAAVPGALAMTLEVWAEGARDPQSAGVLAEAQAATVASLVAAIDAAVTAGWVANVDADAVARWLLSVADGASLWWADVDRVPPAGLRAVCEALLPGR